MRPERTHVSPKSLTLIGIPTKFQKLTLSDFNCYSSEDLKKVKDFIHEYLLNLKTKDLSDMGGVCLFGSNGVGKTMIACLLVRSAYVMRYSSRRVTFVDYLNKYTQSWSTHNSVEKAQFEDELYNSYKAVEFLVLEEIGKEIDSKVSAPILEDLLRYREDNGLVTSICTNLSPKDIEKRYGSSVYSLIRGSMTPIRIEGVDKRDEYFKNKR